MYPQVAKVRGHLARENRSRPLGCIHEEVKGGQKHPLQRAATERPPGCVICPSATPLEHEGGHQQEWASGRGPKLADRTETGGARPSRSNGRKHYKQEVLIFYKYHQSQVIGRSLSMTPKQGAVTKVLEDGADVAPFFPSSCSLGLWLVAPFFLPVPGWRHPLASFSATSDSRRENWSFAGGPSAVRITFKHRRHYLVRARFLFSNPRRWFRNTLQKLPGGLRA